MISVVDVVINKSKYKSITAHFNKLYMQYLHVFQLFKVLEITLCGVSRNKSSICLSFAHI